MAKPELYDHKKFLKLKRLLGEPAPHVAGYLEFLWKRGYQTGNPNIGDELDVEAAAEYPGETGKFTTAALAAGFIDADEDGTFVIHDLYEHAPRYVKRRMGRIGTGPDGPRNPKPRPTRTTKHENGVHVDASTRPPREPRAESLEPKAENQEPRTENQNPERGREEPPPPPPAKRFTPPTVGEVAEYCRESGKAVDAEQFVDFYASKGWRVGDQAMKDWRAAVRTWAKRNGAKSRDSPDSVRQRIVDAGREFMARGEAASDPD